MLRSALEKLDADGLVARISGENTYTGETQIQSDSACDYQEKRDRTLPELYFSRNRVRCFGDGIPDGTALY